MKLLVGILFLGLVLYVAVSKNMFISESAPVFSSKSDPEEVFASYETAVETIKTQREKSADTMHQGLKDIYQKSRNAYASLRKSDGLDWTRRRKNDDLLDIIRKVENLDFIDQVINYQQFPKQIQNDISARQREVQKLIKQTAHNIQNSINFQLSSDGNTVSMKADLAEAAKANEHLQESNVSVNSMIFALQLVAEIAQNFGQDLQNETDKNEQFEKYIEYTIIVYELIGEMIKVLNDFKHKGFSELTSMSNDHLAQIKSQRDSYNTVIKNIKSDFTAGKIDKNRYEERTTLYEGLIESLKPVEKVWQDIKSNLGDKEKVIEELKAKTELLEEKKKDAFNALSTFAQIKIAKGIKNLPQDIFKSADFILDMPLYIPDERTIELYLGVEDLDSANTNAIELE